MRGPNESTAPRVVPLTEELRIEAAIEPNNRRGRLYAMAAAALQAAEQDRNAAEQENKRLRRDSERYRWIRQAGAWESEIGMSILSEDPDKFDAAVDERMGG